jgi:hypothetical protein
MTFEDFKSAVEAQGFPAGSGYYRRPTGFYVFHLYEKKLGALESFCIAFDLGSNEWLVDSTSPKIGRNVTREVELHAALDPHLVKMASP